MKRILIIATILGFSFYSQSQTTDLKIYYKQAFEEQMKMLKGQIPISFKRAVFLTENAYHKGQLNYQTFSNEIKATGQQLKALIKERHLENYKTSGNWAVFTYMMDSLPINNYKPCTYDFDDFMGQKDWTKQFVTKLMKTRSGNCHSLPYYYRILCDEIGAKASLALAPNHVYIKHKDENGQWTNVELTNGGFPRDQWIIEQMAISVESIKTEIYMAPLTEKQNIVMAIFDLVGAYHFQYGNDDFVLKVINAALPYYPNCLPLIMMKSNWLCEKIEAEKKKPNPNKTLILANISIFKRTAAIIDSLGYKDMPMEQYQDWVKSVNNEKQKRNQIHKN